MLEVVEPYGHDEVKKIVNHVDTDGTSVLMAAAAAGNVKVLGELLDRGAEVNTRNVDGHTALMFAYNGKSQEETLLQNYKQYVLEQVASVSGDESIGDVSSAERQDGIVQLIEEAVRSHEALIALLLERGADPTLQVSEGHVVKMNWSDNDVLYLFIL